MFTKEEFWLMWLPMMVLACFAASALVLNGSISKESAVLAVVVAGIAMKLFARIINPSAPDNEVEVESDDVQQ